MSRYFEFFPKTNYAFANSSFSVEKVISNISLKTKVIDEIGADDPYLFLPYTVKEGERPEDIADFYYDSTDYVWLVLMSNNIVDPYTQWPKSHEDFIAYFRKKYASRSLPAGTDPIEWGQNTTRTDNIVHYKKNILDLEGNIIDTHFISPDSYTLSSTFNSGDFVGGDWTAVRYYDYEDEENESKRNILLVNDEYKLIAENNLKRLLNA